MKIKNVSLSFFILASLIVSSFAFYVRAEITSSETKSIFLDGDQDGLSDEEEKVYTTDPNNSDTDNDGYSDGAEVRSGYDPLKKAPGDKLSTAGTAVTATNPASSADSTSSVLGETTEDNLTSEIAQKASTLAQQSSSTNTQISLDDLQTLIDETMTPSTVSEDDLPVITRDDIKIKTQSYSNLSTAEATAKKKDDLLNYIVAITYIFSSNSPKPITSLTDAPSVMSSVLSTITTAITNQNSSGLQDLITSEKKIVEQLNAIEVPEDLVDIHIKALRFAIYSESLGELFQAKDNDPMGNIANLSKIEGFMTVFSDFTSEAQSKFSQYGLTYDETVQKKLESYGISAPKDLSGIESLFNINTDATAGTTTP
ncbi:MAG: hypothetical protein WC848_01925 [Parcubacteria group bacterium]|jgi:hypothetical protein